VGATFRAPLRDQARVTWKRWLPAPVLDSTTPTGRPSEAELDTLAALTALLLPSTASQASRDLVHRHIIDQAARVPGLLAEYRRAVRLLDTSGVQARLPFTARPAHAQLATLRALFPPYAAADRVGRLRADLFVTGGARAARDFVVADLLGAFYRSRQGWATVGYSHYPGVGAADPLDYTRVLEPVPEHIA